jgi:OOP family OmpA-OmpF porin
MRLQFLHFLLFFPIFPFAQFDKIQKPTRLEGSVNTSAEENFPIFLKSDSSLYFIRSFDESSKFSMNDQNIWHSNKENEFSFQKAEEIKALNNKYNNCIVGVNSDETKIYLLNAYGGKKDLKKGICYSEKKGKSWSKPVAIEIEGLNIKGNFYSFHINSDENAIIISYRGPNTMGEEDLYVSLLQDGKWSEPKSLGTSINSTGYEMSPFLSKNSDTLYFSSNGLGGEGDADIFYSTRLGRSWFEWSKPVNLGPEINSPKFDAYFSLNGSGFFWSSNRESDNSDIYYSRFVVPTPPLSISAKSTDVSVYQASNGKIDLTILGGVKPYGIKWSNGSTQEDIENLNKGSYEVTVQDAVGQTAALSVKINEPEPVITEEVKPVVKKEEIEKNIALPKAEIYFDFNSSYLNKRNLQDLDAFVEKIKELKNSKITVTSHCDLRASEVYNDWLSQKRMERTVNYLTQKGINRSRITGYYRGEREPAVQCDNCTQEQLLKNRRTTIEIVSQ